MPQSVWHHALESSANPQRARNFHQQLKSAGAVAFLRKLSEPQAQILAALFSGSQSLSELLVAHPDWTDLIEPGSLEHARQEQGLRREISRWHKTLLADRQYDEALARLRQFKQREMLRIALRDLGRLGSLLEIVREISNVADICLGAVAEICWQQRAEKSGRPYHQDADEQWHETEFCVLGMGKLGGQELNYSSDIDLMFVYTEEGFVFKSPPGPNEVSGKGISNHQFFNRLAQAIIAELTRLAPEGSLYRVDMRLRPEGDAGPLTRSLSGYENFYAQWGQTWERMMLIKARGAAGSRVLAGEFLETVQSFRYPRSPGRRVLREIGAMKDRIENEVVRSGERERNVKLGRGGIREIEFIVQSQQLLHGGRAPFLQNPQTLPALQKLVQYHLLKKGDAEELRAAYIFLRDVEHRLQMEANEQTHTIPTERKAREGLASLMGYPSLHDFETAHTRHAGNVRRVYEALLRDDEATRPPASLPSLVENEADWKKILAAHGFRDVEQGFRLLKAFALGPGYMHVSQRTSDLALELLPQFLALCSKPAAPGAPRLSDPDRVVARLDSFIEKYGARALLYETWTNNPSLFVLLLLLFDRSEFLAETALRTPDLVDELELSGRLRQQKNSREILHDLRHGRDDPDQKIWLRRYHQAEFMRMGLRDILGLSDAEQNVVELTALADACLQYGSEVISRRNKFKAPPFCIIGLGKLGGRELSYGSDLDLIFVADPKTKDMPALQKVAAEIMDLLSSPSEFGIAFLTDARLRPDGEKGVLVNTLTAFEEYYRQRAMLWEIQSLTRVRAIAGDMAGRG